MSSEHETTTTTIIATMRGAYKYRPRARACRTPHHSPLRPPPMLISTRSARPLRSANRWRTLAV